MNKTLSAPSGAKIKERMPRNVRSIIFICAAVYVAAYIGRLSYTASMVGIIEETGASKDFAGTVTTFFYFAYGCGQLINAFFCRRYKPRPVIAGALIISAFANLAAAVIKDVGVIKYIWFLNGAAQSLLWSTLIELLSKKIPAQFKQRAILAMSATVAVGTTSIYGIAAVCLGVASAFTTFYISFAVLIAAASAWLFVTRVLKTMPDMTSEAAENGKAAESAEAAPAPMSTVAILIASASSIASCGVLAVGNGFLRDTMVTWVPSLLYDEFGMPGSYSVVITLVLPILSLCGAAIAVTLHKRISGYNSLMSILYFGSTAAFLGVLGSYALRSVPAFSIPAMIICAGINACLMAAINNVITSMIPLEQKQGAGLFAGIMDAFCYVGSTLSGFLPGMIIETMGYAVLLRAFPILTAILTAFAVCVVMLERRRRK